MTEWQHATPECNKTFAVRAGVTHHYPTRWCPHCQGNRPKREFDLVIPFYY